MSVDMEAVQSAAQSALDAGNVAREAEAEAKRLREEADSAQRRAEDVVEYEVKAPTRPTYTEGNSKNTTPYATEQEVLDFANKLREIGGADVLEALLPSKPGNQNECLIANALNFGCSIAPTGDDERGPRGERRWQMTFPGNMDNKKVREIAERVGARLSDTGRAILLPWHIGNSADAFDHNVGWTMKYVQVQPVKRSLYDDPFYDDPFDYGYGSKY